jgi:hypothetical protein
MSFIAKMVKKGVYAQPDEEVPDIHRRFVKYSKGAFPGPSLKIKITKPKITIKASFDYDDALLSIAIQSVAAKSIQVSGSIISGEDFAPILKKNNFPPDFKVVESKGQAKNFKVEIKEDVEIATESLKNALPELFNHCYVLLSFVSKESDVSYKCKAKPPTPNKKDPSDDDPEKRIGFATLTFANKPENFKLIKEILIPEEQVSISNAKEIIIENNYEIEDLDMPKNEKDSKLIRIKTKRKGKLKRMITIDGKENLFQYDFAV